MKKLEIISKGGKLLQVIIPKKTPEGYLKVKGMVYCAKSPEALREIISSQITMLTPQGYEDAKVNVVEEPEERYLSRR